VSARLLDGRAIAQTLRVELQQEAATFAAAWGRAPALATLMLEGDRAAQAYARTIGRAAGDCGFSFQSVVLPAGTDRARLQEAVRDLNAAPAVDGVIVQFPLPPPLRAADAAAVLDPAKDIDGITPLNLGRLALGEEGLFPATALGGLELLRRYEIPLEGAEAVVVGRSPVVGKPLALLLLNAHATVTLCHTRTRDLGTVTRRADILCAAAGRPGLITGEMVKPGAVVVDFGTTPTPQGLRGDVDFVSVSQVAGWLTPVPGGTGPLTVLMLLRNTLRAAQRRG